MKVNSTIVIVMGICGALAGVAHDLGSYRDAVNAAKKAGTPTPAFDFPSCLSDAATGFTAAATAAIGLSQIPGV